MDESLFKTIIECRICGSSKISQIFDLGMQPPANSLRSIADKALPVIPLSICYCDNCTIVQLQETVKPQYLFKNYVWVTGTSKTAINYSSLFYKESLRRCEEGPLFVLEVASNDGTFLEQYKNNGHKVLGIDPAENIARIANDKGIPTLAEFFGRNLAEEIVTTYGKADFIFARNVIPHVENIHDVLSGMSHCLNDRGVGAIEFHYAKDIIDGLQYDSIYHEHLFYFALRSTLYLFELHNLWAFDLIESPISGGSLVLYFSLKQKDQSDLLKRKIDIENESGLGLRRTWEMFSTECYKHKEKLTAMINKEVATGSTIIGYGASARSSTLLNFCGINKKHLLCIADQNPIKHNKYTAGTDIPIVSPDTAFSMAPNVILLLAWNFKDEILTVLQNKYKFRGKVIVPLENDPQILDL